jgi:sugar lactone lactonase YvrE/ketosteroid isomerase-like protein
MRFAKGILPLLILLPAVVYVSPGAAQVQSERVLTWPSPPAEPVLRLDGVVRKLANFEVAIQGSADGTLRRIDKLKRPTGVDFDERGRLLVTDSRQGALLRLDLDLGVALVFGTGTTPALKRPLGVAAGLGGTIFVADGDLGLVVAFSTGGDVVATYGGGSLSEPVDVALSPDGARLFVADAKANSIVSFDVASRRQIDSFGGRGKGVAEFNRPGAVTVDKEGNLLIVDRLNARVQLFDSGGAFTRAIYGAPRSTFSRPSDVAVDDRGRIFVTDEPQSLVQVYDADLEPLLEFGRYGLGDGEFLGVAGIAVKGQRLAVVDYAGGRVQTFHLYGIEPATALAEPAPRVVPEPERPAAADSRAVAAEPAEEPAEPVASAEPEASATEVEPTPEAERVEESLAQPAASAPEAAAPAEPAETAAFEVAVQLVELIDDWAAAWSSQDVERYLTFYASDFLPANGMSRDQWSARRRQRIEAPESIEVRIETAEVDLLNPDRAEVTFLQSYRSDRFSDRVRKVLVLVREVGGWKIAAETVLESL